MKLSLQRWQSGHRGFVSGFSVESGARGIIHLFRLAIVGLQLFFGAALPSVIAANANNTGLRSIFPVAQTRQTSASQVSEADRQRPPPDSQSSDVDSLGSQHDPGESAIAAQLPQSLAPESEIGSNVNITNSGNAGGTNPILKVQGVNGASGLTVGDFLGQAQNILAGVKAQYGSADALNLADNAASEPGSWITTSETMSERAASYQQFVTGADAGQAYLVNGVKFDGYDPDTDTLLEAKGPGYASFVNSDGAFREFFTGDEALVEQATRQIQAANGVPIQWHVAEPEAADAIKSLLEDKGFDQIEVVHTPKKSGN